jgi:hypothetical protein
MLEEIEAVSRKYAIAVSPQIHRLMEPSDSTDPNAPIPPLIPSPRNSSPLLQNW